MALGATTYEWVLDHERLLEQPQKWKEFYGEVPCWVFTHRELQPIPAATLSFVSVGISPPTASWGELLHQALHQAGRAWWLALFPGAALFILVLGCNALAEGLRDWLDPRRRTA